MQHKTMQAAATITDQGAFTAIAAAYTVDRVNDRIIPGAFAKTIQRWQASGKQIPLHWDHKGDPENIIGSVDPSSMQEVAKGLQVSGRLDLEHSPVAREAWRLMKSGVVALSFGYLAQQQKAADGVNDLTEIDLFEVTVTPAPVQFDTEFLSLKGVTDELQSDTDTKPEATQEAEGSDEDPEAKSPDEEPKDKSAPHNPLIAEAWRLITEGANHGPLPRRKSEPEPEPEPEPLDPAEVTRNAWASILKR